MVGNCPKIQRHFSRHPVSAKNPTNIANSSNTVKQIAVLKYFI
jgi:hypothetical protein